MVANNILVTGGAGFIGSNFLNGSVRKHPDRLFVNLDKLTYAGNLSNLRTLAGCDNYRLERADIVDRQQMDELFSRLKPTLVVHFAAESHVDRSIAAPDAFIRTNIEGTFNLLEAFRRHCANLPGALFHHVSTDEVYGSLGDDGFFTETTPYDPSSPYSASKAASDHLVRAYGRTYGLPIKVTNCSNNYGPFQFPEKLIPLTIVNAIEGRPLPVYGRGDNVRDWIEVEDHCRGVLAALERGRSGEVYNFGGASERQNLEVVRSITGMLHISEDRIEFVTDRPGHDRRYAIDFGKARAELGWAPTVDFETGLARTIDWYLRNRNWWERVREGAYLESARMIASWMGTFDPRPD